MLPFATSWNKMKIKIQIKKMVLSFVCLILFQLMFICFKLGFYYFLVKDNNPGLLHFS